MNVFLSGRIQGIDMRPFSEGNKGLTLPGRLNTSLSVRAMHALPTERHHLAVLTRLVLRGRNESSQQVAFIRVLNPIVRFDRSIFEFYRFLRVG